MIFKVLRFQRVALYTLPHLILQNLFMPGFKGKAVGKISRTSLYNTITRLSVLHEGWGGGLWVAAGTLAKINERPEIIKAALNYANLPKFFGCANFSTMEFFSRATYKTLPSSTLYQQFQRLFSFFFPPKRQSLFAFCYCHQEWWYILQILNRIPTWTVFCTCIVKLWAPLYVICEYFLPFFVIHFISSLILRPVSDEFAKCENDFFTRTCCKY